MEEILQNPKYIIAGFLILIALIFMIIYLFKFFGGKYKIEGNYFMHPMKFISCKIKKTKKKDEFEVTFKRNTELVPFDSLRTVEQSHPNLSDKKGKIKMTGEKNALGNELIYTENDIDYNGVQLIKDYNLYATKDDILILINEDTRTSMVFRKLV
jgi:hypothetical protein